jgi:hypothetical protein
MVVTSQTLTYSRTCTKTRWTSSATYGRWTCECNKHKCNIEGKSQWTTSKCSRTGCVKKPDITLNHSSRNTTSNNPTKGSECS